MTEPAVNPLSACQVAFSTLDMAGTMAWYRDVFGFVDSGSNPGQGGEDVAAMQGLPEARLDMAWLVDAQDFFQLEFFQYTAPAPRPRPAASSWSDIGYVAVGIHVGDFDETLTRLRRLGAEPVTATAGSAPGRRVLVQDPEGVLIEVMEDDVRRRGGGLPRVSRPSVAVMTRFVRVVVPDVADAVDYFGASLGLPSADPAVSGPAHATVWEHDDSVESAAFWAGDFLIEVVHYTDGRSRPRPDDYRLSDQGLMNVALGSRSVDDYRHVVAGLGPAVRSYQETHLGPAVVRYVADRHDLSVEVLAIPDPEIERAAGFAPSALPG